jgi:hypothetical protein
MTYSADGITWTAVSDSTFGRDKINCIAWGGGKFVAVGDKIAYSADGVSWTAVSDSTLGTFIYGIAWGGASGQEKFVAWGNDGKMAYSADGITWTAVSDSTFDEYSHIWSIAYGGDKFVAGGFDGDRYGKMAYSADGVSWTVVSDSTFGEDDSITNIAWGGAPGQEKFVALGSHYTESKMAYWDGAVK